MVKKRKLLPEEILRLAYLVRIKIKKEEVGFYQKQLGETLDYINNLKKINTQKVPPTAQSTSLSNVFFDDGRENKRGLTADEALKNAKKKKDNFFETGRTF